MSTTLELLHARVLGALEQRQQDRLSNWRFAVPRFKEAFSLVGKGLRELHLRGPNKGTKTETVAAYVCACCQKRKTLDGIDLPQWRGPIEAAQLVLDYKQQLLSVQPAYLRVLGDWPYKARYVGEILASLRIKPIGGSDDESTWSVVHFLSQENKRSGTGVRADIVAFDEPPDMAILRELRKAAHAGRKLVTLIGETPTIRRQWGPLKDDYGDSPRASIRKVDRLRAEVRWSLNEVADWVLSPQEKQDLWESYKGDPLFGKDGGARWHGDYTSTEGKCPLDVEVISWMLTLCQEPEEVLWRIPLETTAEGETATVLKVPVQVFQKPKQGQRYYLDIDPASGVDATIKGTKHNPAGLQVAEVGSGDLIARWNGYLAPWSLGVLAAGLARQYGDAGIDIEMKDHWGVNVLRGIRDSRYGNVMYEHRELRPGVIAKEAGFDANEETRAVWIGEIQRWLAVWRAAAKFDNAGTFLGFGPNVYARCPSRAVLECLLDTELDERGKVVAVSAGAAHGEDMVLWGQKLRKAVSRSSREIPEFVKPEKSADQQLAEVIMGKRQPQPRNRLPMPRSRNGA